MRRKKSTNTFTKRAQKANYKETNAKKFVESLKTPKGQQFLQNVKSIMLKHLVVVWALSETEESLQSIKYKTHSLTSELLKKYCAEKPKFNLDPSQISRFSKQLLSTFLDKKNDQANQDYTIFLFTSIVRRTLNLKYMLSHGGMLAEGIKILKAYKQNKLQLNSTLFQMKKALRSRWIYFQATVLGNDYPKFEYVTNMSINLFLVKAITILPYFFLILKACNSAELMPDETWLYWGAFLFIAVLSLVLGEGTVEKLSLNHCDIKNFNSEELEHINNMLNKSVGALLAQYKNKPKKKPKKTVQRHYPNLPKVESYPPPSSSSYFYGTSTLTKKSSKKKKTESSVIIKSTTRKEPLLKNKKPVITWQPNKQMIQFNPGKFSPNIIELWTFDKTKNHLNNSRYVYWQFESFKSKCSSQYSSSLLDKVNSLVRIGHLMSKSQGNEGFHLLKQEKKKKDQAELRLKIQGKGGAYRLFFREIAKTRVEGKDRILYGNPSLVKTH